ncbi:unnamed protein product [Spirodela intermedia]|uniref:Uncharacterized protein n=1 Tax=Spirodela intermedia TaxID=51605 RepID=A0A7I8KSM8_SPIIN|nr:unnamed protein product [Spirodela intermedia]
MAEDSPAPATAAATVTEVVVVAAATAVEEEKPVAPASVEEEEDAKEKTEEEPKKVEDAAIGSSASFKEESNVVADLVDPQKTALEDLKKLVEAALAKNEFSKPPPPPPPKEEEKPAEKAEAAVADPPKAEDPPADPPAKSEEPSAEPPEKTAEETPKEENKEEVTPKTEESTPPAEVEPIAAVAETNVEATAVPVAEDAAPPPPPPPADATPPPAEAEEVAPVTTPEEISLWGVPLLGDEKSDTILLKFLRARDFKVKDALEMIRSTVIWRKEFGIEKLLEEDLGLPELEKVVFMNGIDKEGHPVCYNVYGEFLDKDLYQKVFSDEEKRKKFLQWRILFLEKGIRQLLDFSPSGVSSMVQVTDLKNSPTLLKREIRLATKQALHLLQDNYPEFVAKKVFINVPWWYLAYNRMISPFLTQRTKSKFVFAGPSKSADALFKYIAPEQVPVQFGGLSKDNDSDFGTSDPTTEITVKPSSKHSIEIPVSEVGSLLTWELRVLGWDVTYGGEFVPSAEDAYTVIIQKPRKYSPADEPLVKNSFKIGEPGKVLLTVDNASSRKKKILYRSKISHSSD